MSLLLMTVVSSALVGNTSQATEGPGLSVRRFALITAANDGGRDRPRLRYAETDAKDLARVLRGIGGVAPGDQRLLVQPTYESFEHALAEMEQRLEAARGTAKRIELVVYYSGHSDAEGLLLGGQRYPYRALKDALAALPADVRIAIVDSCASGALTRLKGGLRRPPFTVDESNRVRGYAVLTSSSEDEAAQESDRLGASFFTHYLISGLRGAGDLSQDGRVTLNEAYNFAFHETLARTENTQGGAQHAAYDIQLVGSGDVVMTDLRSTDGGLNLDKASSGRVYIRDAEGRLAVELYKVAGRPVRLGLEPGTYSVTVERDDEHYRAEVTIAAGRPVDLRLSSLDQVDAEQTAMRGGEQVEPSEPPVSYREVPANIGILPAFSFNGTGEPTLNHFSLALVMSHAHALEGMAVSIGANWLEHDMAGFQAAVGFNHVGRTVAGAQTAVGFNTANDLAGLQTSVGFNLAEGEASGMQVTVGANIADQVSGVQIATGLNLARRVDGLQVASGLNLVEELSGGQIGLINASRGAASGFQLGLINYGESVAGLQLGLINIVERTDGLSLGLINYALEDGIFNVNMYSSDIALGGVALAIGTRHLYTAFSAATGTWEDSNAVSFGMHLGFRIGLSQAFTMNIELGGSAVNEERSFDNSDILSSARLMLSYRVVDGIALFGGPTFNVFVDLEDNRAAARHPLVPDYASRPGDDRVYLWPGLIAGVQAF